MVPPDARARDVLAIGLGLWFGLASESYIRGCNDHHACRCGIAPYIGLGLWFGLASEGYIMVRVRLRGRLRDRVWRMV